MFIKVPFEVVTILNIDVTVYMYRAVLRQECFVYYLFLSHYLWG